VSKCSYFHDKSPDFGYCPRPTKNTLIVKGKEIHKATKVLKAHDKSWRKITVTFALCTVIKTRFFYHITIFLNDQKNLRQIVHNV